MVKVIFYNLLRSKYNIKETLVPTGSIQDIIAYILQEYPQFSPSDFKTAVVFHNGIPIHHHRFHTVIEDKEEIIITHFVGGG